jgi:dTDP-4-amino-4,6-dideoxygalactose transaminase
MIKFNKIYTPNKKKILSLISSSIDSGVLTNNGPMVNELEDKLKKFLNVKNIVCVSNGTIAIQLALKAMNISGNILTTPFTYIATSSAIKWENLNILYSDIEEESFNLNTNNLPDNISCIVPVHTFGNPCSLEKLEEIKNNGIKVLYDAAHAFGINYGENSVLKYGNASTLSFHATKVFHTVEGGAIVTEDDELALKLRELRSFGVADNNYGINAKMSEINAAFGLSNLENIDYIFDKRKHIYYYYENNISEKLIRQKILENSNKNFGYYPILFEIKTKRDECYEFLLSNGIETRKYFSPSLDNLFSKNKYIISNNISDRILCLPIYPELKQKEVDFICRMINKFMN